MEPIVYKDRRGLRRCLRGRRRWVTRTPGTLDESGKHRGGDTYSSRERHRHNFAAERRKRGRVCELDLRIWGQHPILSRRPESAAVIRKPEVEPLATRVRLASLI